MNNKANTSSSNYGTHLCLSDDLLSLSLLLDELLLFEFDELLCFELCLSFERGGECRLWDFFLLAVRKSSGKPSPLSLSSSAASLSKSDQSFPDSSELPRSSSEKGKKFRFEKVFVHLKPNFSEILRQLTLPAFRVFRSFRIFRLIFRVFFALQVRWLQSKINVDSLFFRYI